MKYHSTRFEDYINECKKNNLHENMVKTFNQLTNGEFTSENHMIFFGKSGIGKYTQALNYIKKYSQSGLKYERKINFALSEKKQYIFKVSDIHFEIDMELLGCNAKTLFNELYYHIIEIFSTKENRNGIILCKNFHKIHSELLDCFYSYIQQNNTNIHLIYFFVSESVSFLPDNIINNFHIISLPRPLKSQYNKILDTKLPPDYNANKISNIKNILTNTPSFNVNIDNYVDHLYQLMSNQSDLKYGAFRDVIYDIFIYDMEIGQIIRLLLKTLNNNATISNETMTAIYVDTFSFLQYYNNNYRPIYHLENYLYSLINKIHGF